MSKSGVQLEMAKKVTNSTDYYVHPQETWDEKKCEKLAKHYASDGLGTKYPFPGYLGSGTSIPPAFGRIRYNGGCIRNGELYEGDEFPFPIIPNSYEIIHVCTWGWRIIRKTADA